MKLRVGLLGLGEFWETRYRPALRALGDRFRIQAVYSDVAHRADQVAREFDALPVDGFRALTARSDIDAVLMLASDWTGLLPLLAACESGKAIYCATVLDIDPGRAEEIKQRVEQAGVAFMAELPRRQTPATLRLKELIATRLGKPRLLFAHRRMREVCGNGRSRSPHGNPETRELMELADWCCYVVGHHPESVYGVEHLTKTETRPRDYHMMSLDFSPVDRPGTGALAHISCGRYFPATWHEAITFRPPADLQVCCENGVAFIDLPATLIWFDEAGRHQESLESERPVGEQLLSQFHRAVTSLVRKTSDLDDAYQALHILTRAHRSFAEGRRVPLDGTS